MVDSDINSYPEVIPGPAQVTGNLSANGVLIAQSAAATPPAGQENVLEYGSSGNLLMYVDSSGHLNINSPVGTGSLQLATNFLINSGNLNLQNAGSVLGRYNGITSVGGGLPLETYTTGTAAVSLTSGSTAILATSSAIASGLYQVWVNMTHVSASVAGTLTVTYTDVTSNAGATQSYTIAAAGAGVSVSTMFLCSAKTGTAISVAGTSATSNDILATCNIFAT